MNASLARVSAFVVTTAPFSPQTRSTFTPPAFCDRRRRQPKFPQTADVPLRNVASFACLKASVHPGSSKFDVEERTSATKQEGTKESFNFLYGGRVPQWLLERMTSLGFSKPTPIQLATLPHVLPPNLSTDASGEDAVIHAQTGSGKTLAYLLPAISTVVPDRACVQALIVVPTQELGIQVYKLLRRITTAYAHSPSEEEVGFSDERFDDEMHDEVNDSKGVNSDDRDDDIDTVADLEDATNEAYTNNLKQTFPVLPMLNQANLRRQKLQLRQLAPRIIVGNPHRVSHLVRSGRLRLDLLKVLVIDEFDACLNDVETTAALQTILSVRNLERPRQTILASATVPQHRHFLRQCVRQRWTRPSIRHVWLEEGSSERVPPSLSHFYALCDARKKVAALCTLIVILNERMISEIGQEKKGELLIHAMIFVMPSRDVENIVTAVNDHLVREFRLPQDAQPVEGIHNDLSIGRRREAVARFRNGDARIIIGTDVAARGLDIEDVTHVFHFDLPRDADGYLHRAGRAGRQGRPGASVVLVARGEEFVIRRVENTLGIEFSRVTR